MDFAEVPADKQEINSKSAKTNIRVHIFNFINYEQPLNEYKATILCVTYFENIKISRYFKIFCIYLLLKNCKSAICSVSPDPNTSLLILIYL